MNNRIFTVLFLLTLANLAFSQRHICGVSHSDQAEMKSFIQNFNKTSQQSTTRSINPSYIPVKFHMTAKNDGTGRIKAASVLDQMAVLIEDYKKLGMYLYIDDNSFNYLDNTGIYEDPGISEFQIVQQKDPNALNVFICENANTSGSDAGVVLGFYSPSGDYIIMRNQDVRQASTALTHEVGHFFNLMHTFYGWELVYDFYGWDDPIQPWNVDQFNGMYTLSTTPILGEIIELVNKSNCETAADGICDTPPDYNFGLGAGGCFWNNDLRDRNGDIIDPQENNVMGYFGDCEEYEYTDGQVAVMLANFNSIPRLHLKSAYVPDTTEIISNHILEQPALDEFLDYYTKVNLNWSDADGASSYLVTMNSSAGEFQEIIVNESELFFEELSPNTFYFWDVQPFNDGNTKAEKQTSRFRTGSEINTSVKESELIQHVNVFPNPGKKGQNLNVSVSMKSSKNVTISVIDITGKVVSSQNQKLNQGNNTINLDAVADPGIYILKLDSEDGSIHKKIVIQ